MKDHTDLMLQRLMAPEKDWSFAIVFVRGRNPFGVDPDMSIKKYDDDAIVMESEVPHPAPQSQADVQKRYNLTSYIELSEIHGIDFYAEKLITGVPGTGKLVVTR